MNSRTVYVARENPRKKIGLYKFYVQYIQPNNYLGEKTSVDGIKTVLFYDGPVSQLKGNNIKAAKSIGACLAIRGQQLHAY